MKDAEAIRRKILYDSPTKDDAFSGGGHRRTAQSLARAIRDFDDQTRAIGLEGKWGSGKSTIVELAKNSLDTEDSGHQYHIFTFDLWANQTSNFRRSFLEDLLSWLERDARGDKAFIERMRDKIRDRTIDTRTNNTKIFSGFGILVVAFLFFLPSIYMWLSPFALMRSGVNSAGVNSLSSENSVGVNSLSVYTIIALLLVISAIVAIIIQSVRIYLTSRTDPTRKPLNWIDALSRTLSVFSKDAETTQITQNIREVDPSQHEFENTFKEIIASFQNEKRRIIVVFDNIDRLPADKIADAWSHIRTVFSSGREDEGLKKKLTAIVPYDRQHVLRAINEGGEDTKAKYQEDVFRKSFDVIFSVAPPVISDSASFFDTKFEEALNGHFDKSESYRVYKIFDLSMQRDGGIATPRQIIAFINSVTALWEQWQGKIPLGSIAVYIVHRDEIDADPGILRQENSITQPFRDLADDPQLDQSLAALAFNVEPAHALQVLLHGRIEQAFTGNDAEAVKEISKSPGFRIILPEVFSDRALTWATTSLAQFTNAVRNLVDLDTDAASKLTSKGNLLEALKGLTDASPENWERFSDLLKLVSLCTSAEAVKLVSRVSQWLVRSLPVNESDRTFEQGRNWIKFVGQMYDQMAAHHGETKATDAIKWVRFPAGAEFLVGAAYDADQTTLHIRDFGQAVASDGLLKELDERLIEHPEEFYYSWKEIRHLVNKAKTNEFLEKLATHIKTTKLHEDAYDFGITMKIFNALFEWSDKKDAAIKIQKELIDNGALYYGIYELREKSDEQAHTAIATALWPIIRQINNITLPAGDLQGHTFGNLNGARSWLQDTLHQGGLDAEINKKLAQFAIEAGKLSTLIDRAAAAPDQTGLLQEVIQVAVREEDIRTPALKSVLINYDFLKELVGNDVERLLSAVGKDRKEEEWQKIDVSSLPISIVVDAARREEAGWKTLFSNLDDWLKDQEATTWQQGLIDNAHVVTLLRQRVIDTGLKIAPDRLREPIAHHIIGLLVGEIEGQDNLDDVVVALPQHTRKGLASDILERLDRKTVTPDGFQTALSCYPELMAQLPLIDMPDVTARKIVLPALASNSEAAYAYLEAQKNTLRKALKKAGESVVGEIQEFIGEPDIGTDDATTDGKASLRQTLGLRTPSKSKTKNSDDVQDKGNG